MPFMDPERERLAKIYAAMSDAELDRLDEQAHSLTRDAREALETELEKREMHVTSSSVAHDEIEVQRLQTVRQFRDLPEALLTKGLLESAGIPCFLANENIVRMDWFISNFVGGIKLQVRPEDEPTALELLAQPIPEKFDFQGAESFEQPRCPKCFSLDIAYEDLNKPIAYASAYLGVPIPIKQNSWRCSTCGRAWEEVKGA